MKKANNVKELIKSIKDGRFTLDGSDLIVNNNFICSDHNLISLIGAPNKIGDIFFCTHNNLTSLEGSPKEVGGNFYCQFNNLSSLHNIHKHVNKIGNMFRCTDNPVREAILGLLLIDDLKSVDIHYKINPFINKYLGSNNKANAYRCAQELINAGYPEMAKL